MAVAMKAFDPLGKPFGELVGRYAEAGSGRTRIIKHCANLRVARVYAQPKRELWVYIAHAKRISGILCQRIERDVTGAPGYLVDLGVGIRRRERVRRRPELIEGKPGLAQ